MEPTGGKIVSSVLSDFRRAWPHLILTDLLARLTAVAIITPAVGLLIRVFLRRTSEGVLTDEAIASFLLHPFGLLALVVVGAVSTGVFFVEFGQLMVIGFGAIEDRRVTWLDAVLYTYRKITNLIRLGGGLLVRILLLGAPFLAALGGIYWLLVRTHDINYYLARHPPEFTLALTGAGLLLMILAGLAIWLFATWWMAVPLVLFEGVGGRQSLRDSARLSRPHRSVLARWLVAGIVVAASIPAVVTASTGWIGGWAVAHAGSSLALLVSSLGAIILLTILVNTVVSVFINVVFALIVVRLYRSIAGPGELRPQISERGSLGERPSFNFPAKIVLAGSLVALFVILGGFSILVDDPDWEDPTEIIAHRGGAAVAPENTMAAFTRAIADGADWLELDVQENADGEVVVEHDRDFMRAAGVPLEVWQATSRELAQLDIGSSFGPEFSDQRVPTLRQVLELAKGRVGVVIELKYYGHDVALEQKVADLVDELDMSSEIVVMSLNYDGVRKMKTLRPDWTCGLLNAVAIGDLTRLEVDFLALTGNQTTRSMIRRTHQRGMTISAWTIDNPAQMWVMMGRGVDGIITDQVARAKWIQKVRAEVGPVGRIIIRIAGEMGLLQGVNAASPKDAA